MTTDKQVINDIYSLSYTVFYEQSLADKLMMSRFFTATHDTV